MSSVISIVNVPETLDFLLDFLGNSDFDPVGGPEERKSVGPSFATDVEWRTWYLSKAVVAFLPDNETKMLSLTRTLQTKRLLLEKLLDDLPKLLVELHCVKQVIHGKYERRKEEDAYKLEVLADKVKDLAKKRENQLKKLKTAQKDWFGMEGVGEVLGGKKQDDLDKQEDAALGKVYENKFAEVPVLKSKPIVMRASPAPHVSKWAASKRSRSPPPPPAPPVLPLPRVLAPPSSFDPGPELSQGDMAEVSRLMHDFSVSSAAAGG